VREKLSDDAFGKGTRFLAVAILVNLLMQEATNSDLDSFLKKVGL